MRRLTALVLLLALTFGLAGQAAAQAVSPAQFLIPGAGGVLAYSNASVTVANTTGEYAVWSYQVPQGFMATTSLTNQTPTVGTSLPLHLTMQGRFSTGGAASGSGTAPALSIGVNFGGSTATMSLVNNIPMPQGIAGRPMQLDVWIAPIATATAGGNTVFMRGRFSIVTASDGTLTPTGGGGTQFATVTEFNSSVIGTIALNAARTLAVNWRWGSATTTNAATFYERTLVIGN